MLKYWKDIYGHDEEACKFISYFESTWVNSDLRGWFEGFSEFLTNNNGLEDTNKQIKVIIKLLLSQPC
jgi:hypothetical protein